MEVYLFDGGFASFEFEKRDDGSSEVWCRWASWDASLTRGIRRLGRRFVSVSKRGQVEALVRDGGGGVTTRTLGIAAFPVERGNYQEEVLRDYDRACVELSSKTPSGRLLLIAGEPGTGKTYLLRGIVKEVSAAAFVIVQPDTLASLSGPGLLSSVMSLREDRSKDGPIVMLCEDADELLVTRKMDNMSAISALLNLCDGMIGEALDVRIVATTNAKDISIDVALRRPGRMIGYMRTKALSEAQAAGVFRRLLPEVKLPELRGKTLADVYVAAREHGWTPPRPSEPSAFLDEDGPRFRHRRHRHR
jgi:chloramphenicol 3-O-phosphotransferase